MDRSTEHAARRRRRRGLVALLVAPLTASACVGVIGSQGDPRALDTPGDGGVTVRSDGATVLPDGALPTGPGACTGAIEPGTGIVRRLTNREYARTVADVFGQTTDVTAGFPPDIADEGGFDDDAVANGISIAHGEHYRDAAEQIAAALVASPARRTAVVGCDPSGAARIACTRDFIARVGHRAWRRPLATDEIDRLAALAALAASDPDPYAGIGLVVQALLQSPHFLFRVELGVPDAMRPGLVRLTGDELATRLSYLFLGTAPDDALLASAESGALDAPDALVARARTMLADPRARDTVRNFYSQWLQLDQLAATDRDPAAFPAWSDALKSAMASETQAFVDDLVFRDGANFLDLFTARYAFVNVDLARLYGLAPPTGPGLTRVELPADSPRGGYLTQGSFLTLTANDGIWPIIRGRFVRTALLCQPLSLPTGLVVPQLPAPDPATPERDRYASHRTNAACSGCHDLMDPIGFGFENFDEIGRWRTTDAQGRPLSGEGSLNGLADPGFTGARQLGERLRATPEVAQCVVRQSFRYAFGRTEDLAIEGCALAQVHDAFQRSNYDFRELLLAFVRSDAFRDRRVAPAGAGP